MYNTTFYSRNLFLNSVIPLMKEIALRTSFKDNFLKNPGIVQISVHTKDGKKGSHFLISDKDITARLGTLPYADLELEFSNELHFINFFKNNTKVLPKIKGFLKPKLLVTTLLCLMKMGKILSSKEAPEEPEDKELMVRCLFYLLTNGISTLNKIGHPEIRDWAKKSPKRIYALKVDGYDDLGAYILVKAGKTKAVRGIYKRSKPFFTLRFKDLDTALAILLETGDMLELTAKEKLIMEGAPEFGAKLGDMMMIVGKLLK